MAAAILLFPEVLQSCFDLTKHSKTEPLALMQEPIQVKVQKKIMM